MKLVFLGTGGAGAKLKPEGTLEENQRRCTSLLIDDNVVVDMALQSFDYATKLGARTDAITDVFISHTHRDHYMKEALLSYIAVAKQKINIWCHKGAVAHLKLTEEEAERVNVHPVEVMDRWETGGMTVMALPANHLVKGEQPLHYIFEKDGKKLFYGLDGGWFRSETWEYMRLNEVFDAMILEATVGEDPGNFRIGTHNTLPMLRLILAALRQNEMIKENAVMIAGHISGKPFGETCEAKEAALREMGLIPTRDGFTIEI